MSRCFSRAFQQFYGNYLNRRIATRNWQTWPTKEFIFKVAVGNHYTLYDLLAKTRTRDLFLQNCSKLQILFFITSI